MIIFLIALSCLIGGYVTFFFYKNREEHHRIYIIAAIGSIMLICRIYGLYLAYTYDNIEGNINKWFADNANDILFLPVSLAEFFGGLVAIFMCFCYIIFIYRGFDSKKCQISLAYLIAFLALCLVFNHLSFSTKLPSNYIELLLIAFSPLIFYWLCFVWAHLYNIQENVVFSSEINSFEAQLPETKTSKKDLNNLIKVLQNKILENSHDKWQEHLALGKAYFGLGSHSEINAYLKAQNELQKALDILGVTSKIDFSEIKQIKTKYIEPSLKKPIEVTLLSLGFTYFRMNEQQKAKECFKKLYCFSKKDNKYWRLSISLGADELFFR